MGSKVIVFLGFFLLAMILLISSDQVGARDLAETSNAVDTSNEKTNGADDNVEQYGGGYGGGRGGGYGGGRGGGYGGGRGGGYGGGRGGGYGGGYGGGVGRGRGHCGSYGYCGYRCCNYAGEKVDADEP